MLSLSVLGFSKALFNVGTASFSSVLETFLCIRSVQESAANSLLHTPLPQNVGSVSCAQRWLKRFLFAVFDSRLSSFLLVRQISRWKGEEIGWWTLGFWLSLLQLYTGQYMSKC